MNIELSLNPLILAQLRRVSHDELVQIRAEALHIIKIHRANSLGGCLTPLGYLTIPQVEAETHKYETILEHADAVLKEWGTKIIAGKLIDFKAQSGDTS